MSMVDRLIEQLQKRGMSVGPGDKPGELKLHGPHAEATPELLKALKAFKPQLLERYGLKTETIPGANGVHDVNREPETHGEPEPEPELCRLCKRDVSNPENRERLRGVNPWCNWGGIPKGWNRLTEKPIPGKPGCPYRTG